MGKTIAKKTRQQKADAPEIVQATSQQNCIKLYRESSPDYFFPLQANTCTNRFSRNYGSFPLISRFIDTHTSTCSEYRMHTGTTNYVSSSSESNSTLLCGCHSSIGQASEGGRVDLFCCCLPAAAEQVPLPPSLPCLCKVCQSACHETFRAQVSVTIKK